MNSKVDGNVNKKDDPLFNSIRNEPEFQQIVKDIEAKYQAEHERVRKWLEGAGKTLVFTNFYHNEKPKMASIIPGYEYDIFISYRQKDNKYDGWVTEFVDNLKKGNLNLHLKKRSVFILISILMMDFWRHMMLMPL